MPHIYDIQAGRSITRNGEVFVSIGKTGASPTEADAFARGLPKLIAAARALLSVISIEQRQALADALADMEQEPAAKVDDPLVTSVLVEHWDSPLHAGLSPAFQGQSFTMNVVDRRREEGSLLASIDIPDSGREIDVCATLQITSMPGEDNPVMPVINVYDADDVAIQVFNVDGDLVLLPQDGSMRLDEIKVGDCLAWKVAYGSRN